MFSGNSRLHQTYHKWYTNPSLNYGDNSAFYQHMPTLRLLAHGKRVVELGVRYGTSTIALLSAQPASLFSVDITHFETHDLLWELAAENNIPFKLTIADDLTIEIPECDILFIDTLHTFQQLRAELELHADKSCEYIVFHDIVSFGDRDEINQGSETTGLLPAIAAFLQANEHWQIASFYYNNNGLLILRRVKPEFMC